MNNYYTLNTKDFKPDAYMNTIHLVVDNVFYTFQTNWNPYGNCYYLHCFKGDKPLAENILCANVCLKRVGKYYDMYNFSVVLYPLNGDFDDTKEYPITRDNLMRDYVIIVNPYKKEN